MMMMMMTIPPENSSLVGLNGLKIEANCQLVPAQVILFYERLTPFSMKARGKAGDRKRSVLLCREYGYFTITT